MNYNLYFLIVNLLLFSFCLCELSLNQKEKLLNGFIDYYNNLPNRIYTCQEGFLQITQQVNDTTYQIVADIRVTEISNVDVIRTLQCTATVQDLESGVSVTSHVCQEPGDWSPETSQAQTPQAQVEVTEPTIEKKPVQLDNEVQDTAITSGEQFIAVPRDQPSAPCVGCASHVNTQAAGVTELANLGVRHLDIHEPSVKHSLDTVLDVERQVQVVNGVRYVLTLSINFNKCSEQESEDCTSSRICKVTILVKPWVKLPSGGNYRAILANNCTEEWQYGDNGEVVPELPMTADHGDTNGSDDDIQVKHSTNVDAQPNREKTLTDDEIKNIQEQIIPNSQFQENTDHEQVTVHSPDTSGVSKQHVFKVEFDKHSKNSIPGTVATNTEQPPVNINSDKKKAIDDLLAYFDFAGLKPKSESDEVIPRVRRSYDYDLQVLSLAEDYHGIKKSIENARFMHDMAQAMVDYLNEMDIEIKNRAVRDVVRAEEEIDNLQRFVYIQARVIIPCDKVGCEPRDEVIQICNGVIDGTNENSPQILNTFCYNDYKERDYRDIIKEISLDDPVLQRLAKEAMKKIETESTSEYAMKLNKIVSANTQVTSGTLTKFSIIIDYIKCNKSVPLLLRVNCTVLEHLGSKICEVMNHEKHWLKERKISYTCTDRPVDMRISKSITNNITIDDPKVIEMLQEAVQYLETQSNRNNKQKIVNIKSISSQIVAGFLIKIEFVVGYTNCTDENYPRDEISKCQLMMNEGLRLCKAQIWDRSWIIDGRQVEVSCDDIAKINDIEKKKKKRSIDFIGGQVQQSVNDSNLEYFKLANESLKKFLQSTSSIQHYKVVKVNKAATQDVAGKFITIEFSISPTNCHIGSDGILSSFKCHIVNYKNLFRCRSKILENIWLGKKQYFVDCNTKEQEQQIKTHSNELIEHNPSDLKYHQLAEESMKKYLHDTGNSVYYRIARVQRVTTQIVSGLLTSIDFIISTMNETDSDNSTILCRSKILEKHWLGTKDFNVTCKMHGNNIFSELIDLKPDNPKYMQIAVESLQKFIKSKPDSHLVRVTFVDKVIQAGEMTEISFLASHTEEDDGDTLCHAQYTEQGLLRSDIEVKCHLIGTVLRKTEVSEKDPKYYKYVHLADESLHHYLQSINSSKLYTIINIENITVHWEDGIKTLINFIASSIDLDSSEMQGKRCLSQIREQPWLHSKHIDIKCEVDKELYRTKRQIPGDPEEQDSTNSKYKKLAEESLQKYVQESGITQSLEVAQIVKVTTQIVAGTLTKIDFVVFNKQDSTTSNCNSEIWEKPWINFKDIKVSCQNDNQRAKRDNGLPGGLEEKDPTKSEYKKLAEESLQKYVQESGITQSLEVAQVVKVTTQIVAGTLTRINFVVFNKQDSTTSKCNSEIWEKPWMNFKDIKVSCQNDNQRAKRDNGLPGGLEEKDPTKSEYKKLAEESLQKYVQESGMTQSLEVAQVVKVTTQVVAGTLTRINFVVFNKQDSTTSKCNSEIWEKPWMNFKDIKVSCQNDNQRAKRDIRLNGGLEEKDPTKSEYKKLAEESMQKYVQESGITQSLEVAQIVKVTTQIVAGTLTKIDFVVFNKQDSTTSNCNSEIWEKPWINFKDIKVSCQNDNQRAKRDIGLPGGLEEKDPTKSEYKKLAEESLQKYVQESGITQSLEVAQIVKVTTQIVAGTLTKIDFVVFNKQDSTTSNCNSEIWEKPWINFKDIKVSCQNDNQRAKRDNGLPGGLEEKDPTKSEYKKLAEESLQKYVQESGITQSLEVAQIVKVTTQIVAGTLTKIDFVVFNKQDSTTSNCNSEIWEKPWINFKDIKVSCQNDNQRAKRDNGLPGGLEEKDPTKSEYKKLAEESLQKYVQESGITQSLEVAQVVKVTTQVVAGTLTRINFVIFNKQDSTTSKCNSEIWEKPWMNFKDIKVSCQNDNQRTKRDYGMTGGLVVQDPTDPKYLKLAEESLHKYVRESGITQPLKVDRIVKVTTEVVAGVLNRIDFIVSSKQDSTTLKCNSEIWIQSWINFKNIKVSCQNVKDRTRIDYVGFDGFVVEDPTDPRILRLAEESLQKYVQDSGITQYLEVTHIVKVTSQFVAGTLYRINFVVSNKRDSTTLKCNSEIWIQPWSNLKEIKVSCRNDNQRVKRDTGLPGGLEEKDPTKSEYKKLAEESLQKYVQESGITQSLEVAQVVKVTTQIVAGTLTRINFVVFNKQDSTTSKCNSEIWEKPWMNFKDIKVSCQNDNQRAKRDNGLPGGLEEKDPTKSEYKKLAEESLQKYVQESGMTQSLEVAQVVKVTTQVVAGTLTRINFVVFNKQDSTTSKCNSEIWEKPWMNFKDIKVSCQNDNQRAKRDNGLPGGLEEKDPTKSEYKKLAEESLQKYVQESGITQSLEVAQVVKVTTQIVAGTLTRINFVVFNKQDSTTSKCNSEIWEKPWMNFKDIKVSCQNDNQRAKRDNGLPGGLEEKDPTKSEYKKLAEESLQKYVQESGITQSLEVAQVVKVTTQVVAGTLTRINFVVFNKQDSTTSKCNSEIWEKPWMNFKDIKVSCQNDNQRAKRDNGLPGGLEEKDPTKSEYKKLAEESLQKYVQESGMTQSLEVAQVVKVTTQVVAGTLTRINFVVFNKQDSTTSKCNSEIWEKPWINFKDIKVSCQNDNQRTKRDYGMTGGLVVQDPTDPKYKKLAEESLQKYLTNSGNQYPYKLVTISKVTSQVVAGLKTLIDFTVAPTDDLSSVIYCHSNIWEQNWLNKTEIDVKCDIRNETTRKKRELTQGITNKNDKFLASHSRGHTKEEQDPNQNKYKLLAEESLRKYQQKSTIYHKVIEVKRVLTRVISGFKYDIDFSAAPTNCSVNVTEINAQKCKKIDDVVLYCHSEIWDRPWLKQKKIDIQCYGPDDDDFEEYGSDDSVDFTYKSFDQKNNNEKKYKLLAEEASEKYLTTSNRQYVHKVTEIHSVSENIADGTITKIEYSLSPTTCLRNEINNSNHTCKIKKPIVVYNCNAKIWDRPWMHLEKDIKVTCKKASNLKSVKHKRELGDRTVRQIGDDDDEIDEDTIYYYADRAVQHVNDQSQSNNLHKLITIHAVQNSMQMDTVMVKMYIEIAETFCLRHHKDMNLRDCEEMDGLNHRLCFVRLWPSPDDELIVRHVSVVCDDDDDFKSISGVNIPELVRMSIVDLERSPDVPFKLVHQGEAQIIPSLDSKVPFKLNFIIGTTNCSKDVNLHDNPFQCYINTAIPSKSCHSFIWLKAETKFIRYINAKCTPVPRSRRSLSDPINLALDNLEIQKLVSASLEKIEMSSLHRYKQRVLQINSHSTKITSGKVTTIDFDVGYTSCLKYEWVENITSCDFIEHLPRRRCVAQIWQRLWINNGQNIDVNCVDDETPLESHIEFESAEMANELAREALKHIEAKYPHPNKQKVVRIFSLEKQVVAGIHYRMKVEVGLTDCVALSEQTDCKLNENLGLNKFCRVNVWVRPWTDHPPNFRVSCDFQEGTSHDFYHHVQAEQLFYNFLTTYNPSYVNDYSQMQKRFEIFKTNIKKIHEFNVHEKGTATYGVTRFTDLSYEEFSSTYMGLNMNLRDTNQIPMKKADVPDIKIPQNFDWRDYDAVTEVKDQGSCGSCWAFSVTGNIEGQWKMQSGQLVSLSEQELVDCDTLDQGCNGGLPDNAYRAIEQMGGLELEIDYPYEAVDEKCAFNKTLAKVQISGAVNITTNETGMAQWLVHNGPISIGINANAMQFYMGGISHPWKMLCNPTNLDHGVLIVGYGIKDYPLFHKQLPYWIVKNSWGKSWGEQGYYRVYRGDGTCGVNQMASSAVI